MLPASNRTDGQNFGFPDVVNTPVGTATTPIPYPNVAMNSRATGFASTVYIGGGNALNLSSSIPSTSGDEAGTAGAHLGKAAYTTGNPIVNVEKVQAINLTSPTTGNNGNCSVAAVLVPSVSVVSFTFAEASRALDGAAQGELAARIAKAGVRARAANGDGALVVAIDLVTRDVARRLENELATRPTTRLLVLDLRACPGGDLEGALAIADGFTSEGAVLVEVEDVDGDVDSRRGRRSPCFLGQIAILCDRRTASAAEVLIHALVRNERAVVFGEPTFGKGRVEEVHGGAMVTVGVVRAIDGRPIEPHGALERLEALGL